MKTALSLFGDKNDVVKTVAKRMYEARIGASMVHEQLAEITGLDRSVIADIEEGRFDNSKLKSGELIFVATQLGLTIDRLLPFSAKPNDSEYAYWEDVRLREFAGPVVSVEGEEANPMSKRNMIDLYIRITALDEVFV